jgi:hypothetical protein
MNSERNPESHTVKRVRNGAITRKPVIREFRRTIGAKPAALLHCTALLEDLSVSRGFCECQRLKKRSNRRILNTNYANKRQFRSTEEKLTFEKKPGYRTTCTPLLASLSSVLILWFDFSLR